MAFVWIFKYAVYIANISIFSGHIHTVDVFIVCCHCARVCWALDVTIQLGVGELPVSLQSK